MRHQSDGYYAVINEEINTYATVKELVNSTLTLKHFFK